MKVVIIGQQDFGKGVLDSFLARGDEVVGVFCAPEKEGARERNNRIRIRLWLASSRASSAEADRDSGNH